MTIDAASLQRHRAERFFQMAKKDSEIARQWGYLLSSLFQKQVFPEATLGVLMVNLLQKHTNPAPASRHLGQWLEYCHSRNVLHPAVPLWSGTAAGSG